MFAWRFGGQRFPRLEKALWIITGAVCASLLALGPVQPKIVFYLVAVSYAAVFVGTCVQFRCTPCAPAVPNTCSWPPAC